MDTAVIVLTPETFITVGYSIDIDRCHELLESDVEGEVTTREFIIDEKPVNHGFYNGLYDPDENPDGDYETAEKFKSDLQNERIDILVFASISYFSSFIWVLDNMGELLHICFNNGVKILSPEVELLFHRKSKDFIGLEQSIVKKLLEQTSSPPYRHNEKVRQGMKKAEDNSKWVGRPPAGFTVNSQKRLAVDPQQFTQIHQALIEIKAGKSVYSAAKERDVSRSTLQQIANDIDRTSIYLNGSDAENIDPRIESALREYEHSHKPPYKK